MLSSRIANLAKFSFDFNFHFNNVDFYIVTGMDLCFTISLSYMYCEDEGMALEKDLIGSKYPNVML